MGTARTSMFLLRSENLVGFSCQVTPGFPGQMHAISMQEAPLPAELTCWPLSRTLTECFVFPACSLLLLPPPLLFLLLLLPPACLLVLVLVPGQSELHRDPVLLSWIKIKKKKKKRTIAGSVCWPWVLVNHLKRMVLVILHLLLYCLACSFLLGAGGSACLSPPSALRDYPWKVTCFRNTDFIVLVKINSEGTCTHVLIHTCVHKHIIKIITNSF